MCALQGVSNAVLMAARPAGEVEAFFTSLRLTTNVIDDTLSYEVPEDGSSSCTVGTMWYDRTHQEVHHRRHCESR